MSAIEPKLTLVGAGPGDPELISLKGVRALGAADVILYDALVDARLLDHSRPDCIRIYVGKRASEHYFRQEDINRMIVAYAFNHGHVVRLKGGDPFVFGRGQEEKDYAEVFNIPVEIIPGISSATAVPAAQSIPLTMRGVNDGFWVMTATKSYGELSSDIELAAQSNATAVILMGIGKLPRIAEIYKIKGKGDLPVAVIQSGTTSDEKYVVGTMADIAAKAEAAGIGSPGIIIAGKVVAAHADFSSAVHLETLQSIIGNHG